MSAAIDVAAETVRNQVAGAAMDTVVVSPACRARSRSPKRRLIAALLLPLVCAAFGCGTIITKLEPSTPNQCNGQKISPIYSGTRVAISCAKNSEAPLVWFVDVPLSFTADTGVLPI